VRGVEQRTSAPLTRRLILFRNKTSPSTTTINSVISVIEFALIPEN